MISCGGDCYSLVTGTVRVQLFGSTMVLLPVSASRNHAGTNGMKYALSLSMIFVSSSWALLTCQCRHRTVEHHWVTSALHQRALAGSIWDGDDQESFGSLNHPGYSEESNPETFTGGWVAHRKDNAPDDWIEENVRGKISQFDYASMPIRRPPKILVLYGSLRESSFSRKLAFEYARLFELVGCDVRTYNPHGLPVRDAPALEQHPKVLELRALTLWSDGHCWVSPEMHGTLTGCFKNQIDWIPLNTGSVRPTQGKTVCVSQVNGGSQSFNAVNALRLLARWMRMPCCTNQSSVAKAWKEFDEDGRMKESDFRDRVVDVAEEFVKFTAVMAPISDELTNRYSERREKEKEGKLLTQAEKEAKASTSAKSK